MVGAPKYSKVELLIITKKTDPYSPSLMKMEFNDCGLVITGNYIIIVMDEKNSADKISSTVGKIYPLETVNSYKTYSS